MSFLRSHRFGSPYVWKNRPPQNVEINWTNQHVIRFETKIPTGYSGSGIDLPRVNWQTYWQGLYFPDPFPGPSNWMNYSTPSISGFASVKRIDVSVGLASLGDDLPAESDPSRLLKFHCSLWPPTAAPAFSPCIFEIRRRTDGSDGTLLYQSTISPLTASASITDNLIATVDPYALFRGNPFLV